MTAVHKDRSAGLVAFGILAILLATVAAALLAFMAVSLLFTWQAWPPLGKAQARAMLPALGFSAFACGFFVSMGIGSILARRWARAILLAVSWVWLAGGIVGLAALFESLPDLHTQMALVPFPLESETLEGILILVLMGGYVIVPGLIILFYRSRNVKATCEARNPEPCWTDACPLRVLV